MPVKRITCQSQPICQPDVHYINPRLTLQNYSGEQNQHLQNKEEKLNCQ
jgi:hypothetical protein